MNAHDDDDFDAEIAAEQAAQELREETLKAMPVRTAIKAHGTDGALNDDEVIALLAICEREDVTVRFTRYANWEIVKGESRITLTRRLGGWSAILKGPVEKAFGLGALPDMIARAMRTIENA